MSKMMRSIAAALTCTFLLGACSLLFDDPDGQDLVISPSFHTFGELFLDNESDPVTFTISGVDAATPPMISILPESDFQITGQTCFAPVDGQCTVTVLASPGTAGTQDATLVVDDKQAGLTMDGLDWPITAGLAIVFPETASGTPSGPETVNFLNNLDTPLDIVSIELEGPQRERFMMSKPSCESRVPESNYCTVQISYTPAVPDETAFALLRMTVSEPVSGAVMNASTDLHGTGGPAGPDNP